MVVLKNADAVTLEIDSWSDLSTSSKYVGVVASVKDGKSSGLFRRFLLHFQFSTESETAEYLENMLKKALEAYNLPWRKVISITTDGGSNMLKLCRILAVPRTACLAHLLDNVVKKATKNLPCMSDLEASTKSLVAHFTRSVNNARDLNSCQKELDGNKCHIPSYSETRWNSFFDSVSYLLEHREALAQYFQNSNSEFVGLSTDQIGLLIQVFPVLRSVRKLSEEMIADDPDAEQQRGFLLRKAILLTQELVVLAYAKVFESWLQFKQNQRKAFDLDAIAGQENDSILAAIFILEMALSMRMTFLQRIVSDINLLPNIICYDVVCLSNEDPQNCPEYENPLGAMLQARFPDKLKEISKFVSIHDELLDDRLARSESISDTLDMEKSFVRQISVGDVEEVLISLHNLKRTIYLDMEKINQNASHHVKLVLKQHYRGNLRTDSAGDNCFSSIETSSPTMFQQVEPAAPPTKTSKGRKGKAKSSSASPATSFISVPALASIPTSFRPGEISKVYQISGMVPATSVTVERCFSVATHHTNSLRNCLKSEIFADEILVAVNRKLMGKEAWYSALKWGVIDDSADSIPSIPTLSATTSSIESTSTPNTKATRKATTPDSISRSPSAASSILIPENSSPSYSTINLDLDLEKDPSLEETRHNKNPKRQNISRPEEDPDFLAEFQRNPESFRFSSSKKPKESETTDLESLAFVKMTTQAQQKRPTTSAPNRNFTRSRRQLIQSAQDYLDGKIDLDAMLLQQDIWRPLEKAKLRELFSQAEQQRIRWNMAQTFIIILLEKRSEPVKLLKVWMDETSKSLDPASRLQPTRRSNRKSMQQQIVSKPSMPIILQDRTYPCNDEELRLQLSHDDLQEHVVPGDGNCFFSAMVHALQNPRSVQNSTKRVATEDLPKSASECRSAVISYMREDPDRWLSSLSQHDIDLEKESIEDWYVRMETDGTWVNHPVVQAASERYCAFINVMTLNGPTMEVNPEPASSRSVQLLLVNRSGIHYNSTCSSKRK